MWSFQGIDEPTIVKAGHLPIARALGILSLLPLAKPEEPKKLLQRLMLDNWTPATLISSNAGREHPIPQGYWQSEPAETVFRQLRVTFRYDATAATLWKPVEVSGHIVIQATLLRRAVLDGGLIHWADIPETWRGEKDNDYRVVVQPAQQAARAAAFDEAVNRWMAQGDRATLVPKPTISIPTRQQYLAEIFAQPLVVPVPKLRGSRTWRVVDLARPDQKEKVIEAAAKKQHPIASRRPRKKSVEADALIRNRINEVLALAVKSSIPPTAKNMISPLAKDLEGKGRHGYKFESIRRILRGDLDSQVRRGIKGYFKL